MGSSCAPAQKKIWEQIFWDSDAPRNKDSPYAKLASPHFQALESDNFWSDILGTITGKVILDLGCGAHAFSLLYWTRNGNTCLGVDISRRSLRVSKDVLREAKLDKNAFFLIADAEELPIRDSQIDIAYVSNLLHHLPNASKALNAIRRILRKKGFLLLTETNLLYPPRFVAHHVGFFKRFVAHCLQILDPEENPKISFHYLALLRQTGYDIVYQAHSHFLALLVQILSGIWGKLSSIGNLLTRNRKVDSFPAGFLLPSFFGEQINIIAKPLRARGYKRVNPDYRLQKCLA